jgi:16S rRNA (guanine966-N2)-methyltransferase
MRTQIRIVAGSLRGRKLSCTVNASLRPTPQRVREALFSILGDAVPERPFFDIFAGTGVVGLEAISRGASSVTFIERDFRLIGELERHINEFGVSALARIARTDVYRWIERWQAPHEPITLFLSPPFRDYEQRLDEMLNVIVQLQERVQPGSVIVLQSESKATLDELPGRADWDERRYGRNHLLIWVKEEPPGQEEEGNHESHESHE